MATNIFEMFGTIGADDRPANKAIDSVVDNAKRANHTLSNSLGKMGAWATKTGTALTSYITKPAMVAGTALTGLTLWKGLGRLRSLDMAQAKLRGIGIEGKALDRIMETVTETVTGTAFTTADMTNVAATAIASGVKEGKELEFYLKNIANAAAFANVPLDEMAGAFNKVQTQGKLTGEVVQQLGSRGIGILGILADETGMSMEQVSAAVSKGEISAEQFYDAMNNYMGGAAKEVGETWDVALMNIGSRLAILGEKFLGNWKTQEGAFYVLKDVLQDFLDFLPTLNDKAEEMGRVFGEKLEGIITNVKEVVGWFKNLDSDTQKLIGNAVAGFGLLSVGMGPALNAFGKLTNMSAGVTSFFETVTFHAQDFMSGFPSRIVNGTANAIDGIRTFAGNSSERLGHFWTKTKEISSGVSETIGNFIPDSVKNKVNTALIDMGDYFTGWKVTIEDRVGGALDKVTNKMFEFQASIGRFDRSGIFGWVDTLNDKLGGLVPSFDQVSQGVQTTVSTVGSVVSQTTNALMSVVGVALKALAPGLLLGAVLVGLGVVQGAFGEQINAFLELATTKGPEIIQSLINGIVSKLPEWMELGAQLLVNFIMAIDANLPAIFEGGIKIMHGLIDGVVANLPMILEATILIVSTLLQGLIELAPELIIAGLNLLQGLINGIVQNIPLLVKEAQNTADTFAKTVENKLPVIIEKGVNILVSLINGIVKMIPDLIPIVLQIFTTLINAIASNLPQIIAGGIKILGALIDGIIKSIPQLPGVIGQVISTLVRAITSNLPQILSQGLALMGKLAGGIIQGIPQAIATVPRIFTSIVRAFTGQNWISIGKNIVTGIANGIRNFAGNIAKAAKNAAKNAFDSAKSFLGIKSPSRLFRDEIGKYIPQGIAVGIDEDADEVQKSLTDAAKDLEFTPDIAREKIGLEYSKSNQVTDRTEWKEQENLLSRLFNEFLQRLIPYLNQEVIVTLDGRIIAKATRDYTDYELAEKSRLRERGR